MKKTNAMRMLDAAGISYETKEYAYDENDLNGVSAARALGFDPKMVFKTLLARGEKLGPVVFVVPVEKEINLKRAAAGIGDKRVELVHVKELLALTGYIRGGCSPVGMKKKFPTFFDRAIENIDKVSVSAGVRGCQMVVGARALMEFTGGRALDLCGD